MRVISVVKNLSLPLVSSAILKMRFPGITGGRSAAVTMNEAGPIQNLV